MSGNDPQAIARMAEWRRQGAGIWHVNLIAEGYDDEYTILLPGILRERAATKRAKNECAAMIGCRAKHVHVKNMTRKG